MANLLVFAGRFDLVSASGLFDMQLNYFSDTWSGRKIV